MALFCSMGHSYLCHLVGNKQQRNFGEEYSAIFQAGDEDGYSQDVQSAGREHLLDSSQ